MTTGGADVSGRYPSWPTHGREGANTVLQELADAVRTAQSLFCTARDVERLLAALQVTGNVWELAQRSAVPLLVLYQLLELLRSRRYVRYDGERIELTEHGQRLCQDAHIAPQRVIRCPRCSGRGVDLSVLADVRERFARIAANRPTAVRRYDQAYMVEDATLARVAFLWGQGDLTGKELLIIGDDDLVSVAAALTREPARVVVLEVDQRLIDFINDVARAQDLAIEAVAYDVCQPLPEPYRHRFDTFVCDPSESFGGLTAFLARCLLGLRGQGAAGVFGLSRHEASLQKWHRLQRWLNERSAVITEIRSDFSQYQNWPYVEEMKAWAFLPIRVHPEKPWYQSSLIRVELLDRPQIANEPLSPEIFMDEEAATF